MKKLKVVDYSRIHLDKRIASGATASVYKATLDKSEIVALKRFVCDELDLETAQRFMEEACKMRYTRKYPRFFSEISLVT